MIIVKNGRYFFLHYNNDLFYDGQQLQSHIIFTLNSQKSRWKLPSKWLPYEYWTRLMQKNSHARPEKRFTITKVTFHVRHSTGCPKSIFFHPHSEAKKRSSLTSHCCCLLKVIMRTEVQGPNFISVFQDLQLQLWKWRAQEKKRIFFRG